MRALVFTAPHHVEVREIAAPTPTDDEVLVRVEAVGICGSELHGITGNGWRQPPLVMGHELVGTDPDGRRVAINPLLSCGRCDACTRQEPNLCRSRELLGVQRAGGFAEYVAVPRTSMQLLPDDVGWAEGALIEPLANAVHACHLAGPLGGARIAVVGAGALGLLCTAVAADAEPAVITVADPSSGRLAVAKQVGATEVVERLSDEYDVVIDCVGAAVTRVDSVARLRPGGTAIWLGLSQPDVTIDGNALVRDEKRVLGSFAYTEDEFAEAMRMSALTDLSWTTSVALEDSAQVFLDLAAGRSDIVRAVIRP